MISNVSKAVVIGACLCFSLQAQSVLSVQYPGGLPVAHSTGPSLSIGGAGTGIQNDFFGIADNIANLGCMNRAVFSAVTSFDFLTIHEHDGHSTLFTISPRLFTFAFPISRIGAFGISVDKRGAMKMNYDSVARFPDVIDSLALSRRGGLTSWQVGWGYSIGQRVNVGLGYERIYLIDEDVVKTGTNLPTGISRYDSTRNNFSGNAVRLGVMVPIDKFMIGATGEYYFKGKASRETGNSEHYGAQTRYSFKLPPSISGGVSYTISPEWLTAASIGCTFWNEFYSGIPQGRHYHDALSFSAGTQYIPAPNLLAPKYWETMQYRGGIRYSQLPAATASEMALSLGLGLPLQKGGGLADLVVELGRRSDGRYKKYSENFAQIILGINGGRKWFQTTETRY